MRKFASVTCGIFFSLVMIEALLRLLPHLVTSVPLTGSYHAPCFVPGTYYWFGLKPGSACTLTSTHNAFPPVTIMANSMGLRSPEIQHPKPEGTIRALFLGDSFAMGWGVKAEEAYPAQTARFFNDKQTGITMESVNAGLVHTAMGYQYLFLKNELDRIRPDVIVLGFYPFNDVFDSQYSSKWKSVDENGLPVKIESVASFVDRSGQLRTTYNEILIQMPILRESRILLLLSVAVSRLTGRTNSDPPETYLRICIYKSDCAALNEGKTKVKTLFTAIRDRAATQHIPILVVMKPVEFVVSRSVRFPKYGIPYTLTPEEKKFPFKEFRDFFTQNNIPYLYLRDTFLAHEKEGLYFPNDDHWTPRGHEVAGEAIASKLTELLSTPSTK